MNQKGFGRLEVIGFLAVVALSMTIVWILVRQLEELKLNAGNNVAGSPIASPNSSHVISEFNVDTYAELENKIAEESMNYFNINQTAEEQVVSIAKLVQNSYIPQVYSLKKDVICTGYVEYHRNINEAKTYLKCDEEYQTEGYVALND